MSDWQACGLPHSQEQALGPWLCPGSEHANCVVRAHACACIRQGNILIFLPLPRPDSPGPRCSWLGDRIPPNLREDGQGSCEVLLLFFKLDLSESRVSSSGCTGRSQALQWPQVVGRTGKVLTLQSGAATLSSEAVRMESLWDCSRTLDAGPACVPAAGARADGGSWVGLSFPA